MPAEAQEVVSDLLAVISRRLPLAAARELLCQDVALYMDGRRTACGQAAWFRWVCFLHRQADKKMRELTIVLDTIRDSNDSSGEVQVTARWQALVHGEKRLSLPGQVIYRVREGKIVSIKTHRRNYIFIHGAWMARSRLGFYVLLLRLMLSPRPVISD